jgi:hypothetical protein
VDPKADKYPSESPYIYCGNNPLYFIDREGNYKYPTEKEKSYARSYPMLTKYLSRYVKDDVLRSKTIMAGLLKYSGGNLTEEKVKEAVTWGSGPYIEFIWTTVDVEEGIGIFGKYDEFSNTISISKQLADKVESILSGNGSEEEKLAALYEFYATLLHETVHYGDELDGERMEGADVGWQFMSDIFESKDVVIEGETLRAWRGSVHHDSKALIKMQREEGKTDVLPTLPSKE